ncbi:hypothetical protein [Microbacterium sulfonylureivorans]|uniref:hypothetical protein n=1 Tax=Microbacterium sulfonylureivorans TaxID=2486854 RepID=UPI000FDC95CA|nr:hypothetical protein [Microbacterium sulfonylureivorans]
MSTGAAALGPVQPVEAQAPDVGLWRVKWFRILTVVNSALVAVSAAVAVMRSTGVGHEFTSWAFIAFPVVGATLVMPWASAFVIGLAAAFSALNAIGGTHKGARFLRAMTVWGTIVLGVPVAFTAFCGIMSAIGAIV